MTSRHRPDVDLQRAGHADLVETQAGETYLVHLCGRPLLFGLLLLTGAGLNLSVGRLPCLGTKIFLYHRKTVNHFGSRMTLEEKGACRLSMIAPAVQQPPMNVQFRCQRHDVVALLHPLYAHPPELVRIPSHPSLCHFAAPFSAKCAYNECLNLGVQSKQPTGNLRIHR